MLPGQFIPRGLKKRRDVIFIGEKPALYFVRHPEEKDKGNFNATKTDFVFQEWISKYLRSGVYVTDMVKTEGRGGADFEKEWKKNPQFSRVLLKELKTIKPKIIVLMSRKTAVLFEDDPLFSEWRTKVRIIYHPSYVTRYHKFTQWDSQFKRITKDLS